MLVTREQVCQTLASQEPEALWAILTAAGLSASRERDAALLAKQLSDALFWHYATPLGYALNRATLDDVVAHVARLLGVPHRITAADPWEAAAQLAVALRVDHAHAGVTLSDLDPSSQAKLRRSWLPSLGLGVSAAGAGGTFWVSGRALAFFGGPVGRVLPYLPPLAPWVAGLSRGASALRLISGPLGIAMTILAVNQSLGANDRKLVPLLLGVGALGPHAVNEAEVLVFPN